MKNNKKLNIAASIQARMGSSRLPGKVMKDVFGKPLLLRQIERIQKCQNIQEIIVSTTTNTKDDPIVEMCKENSILYFRGSEDNVLDRIARTINNFEIDIHAEFVGDSPLPDFELIDSYINMFLNEIDNIDYLSNCINTTFPPGMDIILYKSEVLTQLNNELNKEDPLREHVGYNITRFPEKFRLKSLNAPSEYFDPNLYLEVDTEEDLLLIKTIFQHFLDQEKEYFSLKDILKFISTQPQLRKLNSNVKRNWKSLRGEDT